MRAIELVNKQAEDDGLWFNAQTAPEAYLQQSLRKLHAVVESEESENAALHTEIERINLCWVKHSELLNSEISELRKLVKSAFISGFWTRDFVSRRSAEEEWPQWAAQHPVLKEEK